MSIIGDIIKALFTGLAFLIVAWTIEFIRNRVMISFAGIGTIHRQNLLLIVVDLLPFVFVIAAYLTDRRRLKDKNHFVSRLSESDSRMNAMADFAKQIGSGNYHTQLTISTDHDILAQSLLLMRDNLLQNFKKETEQSWIGMVKKPYRYTAST
jgi:hypothetical protein